MFLVLWLTSRGVGSSVISGRVLQEIFVFPPLHYYTVINFVLIIMLYNLPVEWLNFGFPSFPKLKLLLPIHKLLQLRNYILSRPCNYIYLFLILDTINFGTEMLSVQGFFFRIYGNKNFLFSYFATVFQPVQYHIILM